MLNQWIGRLDNMIKLLVIADDITGALDTGVQFSKKGVPTLVATYNQLQRSLYNSSIEVLVIDVESRHLTSAQAYDTVFSVAKFAADAGVRYFYKKTDSTLRGNIGAELTALIDACKTDFLAFVPAFPKNSRTTQGGIQYVDDTPLCETGFSNDPFEPVSSSSIAEIIAQQSDIKTLNILTDQYDKADLADTNKTIYIFDAQTDSDMEKLGNTLKSAGKLQFLAGCAGFAEMLPSLIELHTTDVEWLPPKGNQLIITGSVNQVTINQLQRAKSLGYYVITLDTEQKLDPSFPESFAGKQLIHEISTVLGTHQRVIIESVNNRAQMEYTEEIAKKKGLQNVDLRQLISDNIGSLTQHILNTVSVNNLIIFGGDTLYSILQRIDCDGIVPLVEISPGVVLSKTVYANNSFSIITKSGGLGDDDVVSVIDSFILQLQQ